MPEPDKLSLVEGGDPSADYQYNPVNRADIAYVEIFPSVGIARFGDSEKEYFIAPEVPGHTCPPVGIRGKPKDGVGCRPPYTEPAKFRDSQQRIRRQAVRFRVYAYNENHELLGEINDKVATASDGQEKYALEWAVHVANRKGAHTRLQNRFGDPPAVGLRNPDVQKNVDHDQRTRLIVDSKKQEISSSTPDPVDLKDRFQGSNEQVTDINSVYLGQLQVDSAGRLLFIPGTGHAKSVKVPGDTQPEIVSAFDSVDWVDTACDGRVTVQVTTGTWKRTSKYAATVISGPPKFAWGIMAPTTLYNIMENIYWRHKKPLPLIAYNFDNDIWPLLKSASLMSWTNDAALQGHGPSTNGHFASDKVVQLLQSKKTEEKTRFKTRIFEKLRKPDYEEPSHATVKYMPRLGGDHDDMPLPGKFPPNLKSDIRDFAALTKLQYERFRKWKDDTAFKLPSHWKPEPKEQKIEDFDVKRQPEYLARASLESTVGDSLLPGMETDWVAKEPSTYDLTVDDSKYGFRVNNSSDDKPIKPGYITQGLSVPWQSDLQFCDVQWWPSNRPDNVVPKVTYDNMMDKSGTQTQFDEAVTTRKAWTRGMRESLALGQTLTSVGIPMYANTDMTRYWNHLGIVRKDERTCQGRTFTAYVESERLDL